jgi:nucleoside-diphosphate-sugar epimerase
VHSYLDLHGFFPTLVTIARETGIAAYPNEGENRWPAVDTRDAARAYRLALESAPGGTRIHAIGDEGVPFKEIAAAIGRHLDLPVQSAAPEHFRFLERFVVLDGPASSELTRKILDWEPTYPGLIADIDEGHYFKQA